MFVDRRTYAASDEYGGLLKVSRFVVAQFIARCVSSKSDTRHKRTVEDFSDYQGCLFTPFKKSIVKINWNTDH